MKKFFYSLLCLLFLNAAQGQGWEKSYPIGIGLNYDEHFSLTPMPDGGFLMTANDVNQSGIYTLIRLAPDGTLQSVQSQEGLLGMTQCVVSPADNNGFMFLGRVGANDMQLAKTDANLNLLWTKPFAPGAACPFCDMIVEPTPGGLLISWRNVVEFNPVTVLKIDFDGDVVWERTYSYGDYDAQTGMRYFLDMAIDSQGNIYLSGVGGDPHIAKISPNGDSIFLKSYAQPHFTWGFYDLAMIDDNRFVGTDYIRIAVMDSTGALVNVIPYDARQLRAASDGNLLVGTVTNNNLRISKITLDGEEIWGWLVDNILNMGGPYSLWAMPDGGTVSLGRMGAIGSSVPYVIRTDSNGIPFTNRLYGNVFADLNSDCINTLPDDLPIPGLVVQATNSTASRYATTDALGNYSMALDTGEYLLRFMPPNDLWMSCVDSIPLIFNSFYDTVQQDVGMNSELNCPWPEVGMGITFLRRCSPLANIYTVTYSNSGNVQADSAVVRVTLDPFLTLTGASIPYTTLGPNTHAFFIGNLPPLASGSFSMTVDVDCENTVLGQTHCSSAEISIANLCPLGLVEEPIIEVDADCEGDSVQFTLRNVGGAPMPGMAEFIVIEDLIVMREGSFQLDIQQDTLLKCPANGATFRIYAGHEPGELPFFSPTAAVEGCNGPIQAGVLNMFPALYPTRFVRDCQNNIGPYDPNDKQAVPTGYGPENYIGQGVPLDYKIRFQNTGTDTAFNIVIRDTLSAWLDPASVRPGAASHPYVWALLGQNVLEFKFENIMLPDSNVNLEGSQGFVKFFIEQKPNVPLETDIFNHAAIYFDFNAPIFTNTTHHRVGKDFVPTVSSWSPANPLVTLRAYPNPASEIATVELGEVSPNAILDWTLSDATGRTALRQTTTGGRWDLRRDGLTPGIYWLQVREKGKLVGIGKLVIH